MSVKNSVHVTIVSCSLGAEALLLQPLGRYLGASSYTRKVLVCSHVTYFILSHGFLPQMLRHKMGSVFKSKLI